MNINKLLKNKWFLAFLTVSFLLVVSIFSNLREEKPRESLPAQVAQTLPSEEKTQEPEEKETIPEDKHLSSPAEETRLEVDPCASVVCSDCQYCNNGSCINYCTGADGSCGCRNCVDCNKSDGWTNVGYSYPCCSGENICNCQKQEYHDYRCLGASCNYSVTNTKVNKDNCFSCGNNRYCSGGTCKYDGIEGLASIRISGGIWENWDADAEEDGPFVDIVYLDGRGDIISSDATEELPISAYVQVFATDRSDYPYKKGRLVFSKNYSENQIILGSIYPRIRIPKEEISVNPFIDYRYGYVSVTIYTPKQGSFSDESDFIVLYEE